MRNEAFQNESKTDPVKDSREDFGGDLEMNTKQKVREALQLKEKLEFQHAVKLKRKLKRLSQHGKSKQSHRRTANSKFPRRRVGSTIKQFEQSWRALTYRSEKDSEGRGKGNKISTINISRVISHRQKIEELKESRRKAAILSRRITHKNRLKPKDSIKRCKKRPWQKSRIPKIQGKIGDPKSSWKSRKVGTFEMMRSMRQNSFKQQISFEAARQRKQKPVSVDLTNPSRSKISPKLFGVKRTWVLGQSNLRSVCDSVGSGVEIEKSFCAFQKNKNQNVLLPSKNYESSKNNKFKPFQNFESIKKNYANTANPKSAIENRADSEAKSGKNLIYARIEKILRQNAKNSAQIARFENQKLKEALSNHATPKNSVKLTPKSKNHEKENLESPIPSDPKINITRKIETKSDCSPTKDLRLPKKSGPIRKNLKLSAIKRRERMFVDKKLIMKMKQKLGSQYESRALKNILEIRDAVKSIRPSLFFGEMGGSESTSFRVLRVLGSGNFSTVKLMERKSDTKKFAGKFIRLGGLKSRRLAQSIKVPLNS